jgi:hypothetical protein
MKKLLLLTLLIITCTGTAQSNISKQKEVDISIKFQNWINSFKKNEFFSFIGNPPEKMFEVYDCNGVVEYYNVKAKDYSIEFRSNNIVISHEGTKYYLTMVNNDFVGYGCTLDTREKRMTTYYFQNEKIVKKSVKNYSI